MTAVSVDHEHPLVEKYLQANAGLVLAPTTVDLYGSQLSNYIEFLEDVDCIVLDAEKEDVVAFLERCVRNGNRKSTLEGKLSTITEFYKFVHLETESGKQLSLDPLDLASIDVGKYRVPDSLERIALTKEEVRKLFDAISTFRNRLLVVTAVETGIRNSDLRGLMLADVHLDAQRIHVRDPKGDSPYDVPISDDLAFDLDYWIHEYRHGYGGSEDTPYLFPGQSSAKLETNGSLNNIVKEAAETAGIQDVIGASELTEKQQAALNINKQEREWSRVTVHTLRHTYITLLQKAGVPLSHRQHVANHQSPETTRKYSHGSESILDVIRQNYHPPK